MVQLAIGIVSVVVVMWAGVAVFELIGAFVGACADAVHRDGKSVLGKEIGDLTPAEAKDWLRRHGL